MAISPTIKLPIVLMPQSVRFASRSGCLLAILGGLNYFSAQLQKDLSGLGRYRIAGDVPSASITQIDLLDCPTTRNPQN